LQFRRTCVENDVDVSIDRVYRPTGDELHPVELTDEQREALVLARREGYFDVPRGITLEELGTMLDISRQAVSNRLRRGTRHLVDDVGLSD
jgi:predicted DNA binding protein